DARSHEIKLELAGDLPAVRADAALLERVIANVVDNALKWSPPDCDVTLHADAHAGRVLLLVVDHGPGIRPDDRRRVFEPFQRVGDRPTVAGTRLGPAAARRFIDLMGGELDVEDTP